MKRILVLLPVAFLLLTFSSTSFAQMMLGPKGIGGFAGYVKPEDIDGTFGFGAVVDLGTFTPALGWEVEGAYWSKSETEEAFGIKVKATISDIAISSHLKYRFPMPQSPIKPYAGGGIGIHIVEVEGEVTFLGETETASETETKFGFHLLGGGEFEASPQVKVFAEARFSLVEDFNQFGLFGGAKFKLGM